MLNPWNCAADWKNPSTEAIAEAKSKGIDLTDPSVIDMLEEYEEEARASGGGKRFGQDENHEQNLVSIRNIENVCCIYFTTLVV